MAITKVVELNGNRCSVHPDGSVHKTAEYYGLSTDVKPIEGVKNADVFMEMNKTADDDGKLVNKVYIFDADNQVWLPL